MLGRKCSILLALGGIALCLLAPGRSSAQAGPFGPVSIGIDDSDRPTGEVISLVGNAANSYGFDPQSFNADVVQEGIFIPATGAGFGIADFHGEWFDHNPLAPGQVVTVNFHLIEPAGEPGTIPGSISDTISVTLTGHSPNGRLNNMTVDEHFRSGTLDDVAPPALVNPIVLTELNTWMDLTPYLQAATSIGGVPGITDFSFRVNSAAVPEPGSMAMLGGIAISGGLVVWRRRRR